MIPLVLVHGFLGGSAQWDEQKTLAKNRQLICVDLPGFGKNATLPPLNVIEEFAQWVLEELAAQNIDHFDLLGHSMGGMIVQEMVKRAPDLVHRLVLYGTGPMGNLPGRFEPIETSMERVRLDGPEATALRIAATWFQDRSNAERYDACAEIARCAELRAHLAGLEAMKSWSGVQNLAAISCPTLVLWGDGDRTYPWAQIEQLWRKIPDAQLAVIPGCAHAVHMERPEIFNMLIRDFMTKDA